MVMEQITKIINSNKQLFELSNNTVHKAAEKSRIKNMQILKRVSNSEGVYGNSFEIDEDKFKEFLATLNPAQRNRYLKLAKNGKLVPMLLRQAHILGTVANSDLEWFREHTDISLSPEFFQSTDGNFNAIGKNDASWGTTRQERKPTKDEHDFYRFFISMGTDVEGMTPENIERYRNAWRNFYIETMDVDPTAI